MQPVEGALVDLAGDRYLPLALEAADRLDRRGVVRPGGAAEVPASAASRACRSRTVIPVSPFESRTGPGSMCL